MSDYLPFAHAALAGIGAILALWVMMLAGHGLIGDADTPAVRCLRRGALGVLSISMLFSVSYALQTGWYPWPSTVVIIAAVDVYLLAAIIGAHVRIRRITGASSGVR